jgi:hypothetical protein
MFFFSSYDFLGENINMILLCACMKITHALVCIAMFLVFVHLNPSPPMLFGVWLMHSWQYVLALHVLLKAVVALMVVIFLPKLLAFMVIVVAFS